MFVVNGVSGPMLLPHYSYMLADLIPQARVKIYADHSRYAGAVTLLLRDPERELAVDPRIAS